MRDLKGRRSADLIDARNALDGVLAHWKLRGDLDPDRADDLTAALAPTVEVRRSVADHARDALRDIIRLTEEQARVLSMARRNHRATILGGAGTGKTVLATEKARQLAKLGNRTLLLCYNRLLADMLRGDPSLEGVSVGTFHSHCEAVLARRGRSVRERDDAWWERDAALALMEADAGTGPDAIVVNEGQDFAPDWLEALESTLAFGADSPFYVFADPNQVLWERGWKPPVGGVSLALETNCRNTLQIARRVAAVAAVGSDDRAAGGPEPIWTEVSSPGRMAGEVVDAAAELLEDGFAPHEVVVLCENAALRRELASRALPGTVFTGHGGRGVVVETIGRFKGLEADAVIVALDGVLPEDPDRSAYVGFSRARSFLRVLGSPRRRRRTRWDS